MPDRPVRPKYCQYESVQSGILFFPLSVSWGSTSLVPLIVGISNCSYLLSYIQYIRYCQQEKSRYQTEMNEVHGATRNLLTKIKCFLSLGEIIVHPNLGALNKPSLTMVKKNYSSSTFAFIGILPLPGHSRFVKIYLTLQSLPAFYFSLQLLS